MHTGLIQSTAMNAIHVFAAQVVKKQPLGSKVGPNLLTQELVVYKGKFVWAKQCLVFVSI